jgi:glycosyltransferase involved in cell wall biosynthesis
MEIGIITDLVDRKCEGIGKYTYNLIKGLNTVDKKNQYNLIHYKKNDLDIYKVNNEIYIPRLKPFGESVWRCLVLPFKFRNNGSDIIHDPTDGIGALSFKTVSKRIITMHDLIPFFFPEYTSKGSWIAHKILYKKTIDNADMIITDSNSSKMDILNNFKVPEKKIRVIYIAADKKYKVLPKKEIEHYKKSMGFNFPFILYLGALDPRKNIPNLIKSFYQIKKKGFPHKLVIVGGIRFNSGPISKTIHRIIQKLNLNDEIILTGHLPEKDIPKIYNAAELFVFPSFYEGFGLPPLEAMSSGTPVITSNTSSLPEVVGEAGITIDPHNVNELADSIINVITNDSLQQDMIKKGLKKAKSFSWINTAKETLSIYNEIYEL